MGTKQIFMSLKVAVVGAGYLGQHHARVYSELQGVELVGIVDIDAVRAEEVAKKCSSKPYLNYLDVLGEVDALSIVVPTPDHFKVALGCLRAGKDVLIEKPITETVSQADELINEAKRTNRILQVGHLERYNPGVIALSQIIKEPRFIEAVRLSPVLDRGCDVDVTLDLMIHDIDMILSFVHSPIKNIHVIGFSLVTEKIDEARVWAEFENGAVACLFASRFSQEKQRKLKVIQKNSYIELDYQTGVVEIRSTPNPLKPEVVRPEYREPLKEEIKDFIHCVESRERPRVSGAEGRNALAVALEINSLMERN